MVLFKVFIFFIALFLNNLCIGQEEDSLAKNRKFVSIFGAELSFSVDSFERVTHTNKKLIGAWHLAKEEIYMNDVLLETVKHDKKQLVFILKSNHLGHIVNSSKDTSDIYYGFNDHDTLYICRNISRKGKDVLVFSHLETLGLSQVRKNKIVIRKTNISYINKYNEEHMYETRLYTFRKRKI